MTLTRYLVIGRGKTGTTGISKTIQNTLRIENYHLEPKNISFFEILGSKKTNDVVKIVFDHWQERRRLLNAIIHNELRTDFIQNIFITRDPRGEFISRLHYIAFPFFLNNESDETDVQRWVDIFRRKEDKPENLSLEDIVSYLRENFGVYRGVALSQRANSMKSYSAFLNGVPVNRRVVIRYEDFVSNRIDNHTYRDLFAGSRDVGEDFRRTRRSGGAEDWGSFVLPSDRGWIDDIFGEAIEALGYDRHLAPIVGKIDSEHSSRYVERIIREAKENRSKI